jgi:CRP/FNR family transcriptional regulator
VADRTSDASFPDLWRALADLRVSRRYEQHMPLFRDGEPCTGIYFVEVGQIHLLLPVRKKQYKLFDVAGPGALLGLSESMGGAPHKLMAEAAPSVEVAYVERMALMRFLRAHHTICMQVVRWLSEDLHALYHRFRELPADPQKPGRLLSQPPSGRA